MKPISTSIRIAVAALFVVITAVGTAAGTAWAMYVKHSDSMTVRRIASAFSIPAARVGDRTVSYLDYLSAKETMRIFLASEAAAQQGISIPFDQELEKNIFEKLINEAALFDVAEARGIDVADSELRAFYADVVQAASGTTSDIGQYLLDTYGWDEETFRQRVLRVALTEEKLTASFAGDGASVDPAAVATAIRERLDRDDVKRYLRF